jgi:hypothetical protein
MKKTENQPKLTNNSSGQNDKAKNQYINHEEKSKPNG